MSDQLQAAMAKIRAMEEEYCENQMYFWPGFNPIDPDPEAFFAELGIEFDGVLFIRYPMKRTFHPLPADQIASEEQALGVQLPQDYKRLLQEFGAVHLPGDATVIFETPANAVSMTRQYWSEEEPLPVLAIAQYWAAADGNAIGFVRQGDEMGPEIYEFDHELVGGEETTRKISDSLAGFLLEYLA